MTKLDEEVDRIHYEQGQSIVQPKTTAELLKFAAGIIREKTSDPYNRALADELVKRAEPPNEEDWTIGPEHRSNTHPEFVALSREIGRLICDSAFALLAGGAYDVGGLIMAQLAHKHGLVPRHLLEKK